MTRLLRCDLYRLSKNRLLPLCVFLAFVCTAAGVYFNASSVAEGEMLTLEEIHFSYMPLLPALFAVFTSLFFGTEYSDHTMRNKLITGSTRASVYFSSLLTAALCDLLITAAWFAGGLTGIDLCGVWTLSAADMARYLSVICFAVLAYTAVLTFLFMLCDNRALNVVLSLPAVGVIVLCGSILYQALSEDEFTQAAYFYDGTDFVWQESEPNPHYIGGGLRVLLKTVFYLLPGGQAILAANIEITEPLIMCLFSALLFVFVTAAGIMVFRKKDIK